jgi:hypothetical protein
VDDSIIESNRSQLEITPLLVEAFNGSKDHATLFHPHHKLNDVSPKNSVQAVALPNLIDNGSLV